MNIDHPADQPWSIEVVSSVFSDKTRILANFAAKATLKGLILGTHQRSVAAAHVQSYLEEFTFRFNRRTSRSRGLVFRRLVEQAVVTGPVTEPDVTHGYKW